MKKFYRGIRPDDPHGRCGLRNPERGLRTEMYFSEIPGEIAGVCSCYNKQLKLDGRPEIPVYQNDTIPDVPHLIRGNRLDAIEFSHWQWMNELDYFAYDGVTIMQSYCFLDRYNHTDLPQSKLDDIEFFFNKVRLMKVKLLLRFAYELSPAFDGPTAEDTLRHLRQLAPLIRKHSDIIYCLQCGFVGKFGEWHNSYNHLHEDVAFHKDLLAEVLEILPDNRMTMMRYPAAKMRIFGTEPITEKEAFSGIPKARVGHFNDGFMANVPKHGGTFGITGRMLVSIEDEMEYVAQESKYMPQDGELFWRDVGGAALPTESLKLLRRWHFDTLSMVHGNAFFEGTDRYSIDIWKKVPVDPLFLKDYGFEAPDGYFVDERGRFVRRSYYELIRDLLGYRLELQSAEIEVDNGTLTAGIELVNRGFSAPVNPRKVYLTLRGNNGKRYDLPFDIDIRKLYGGEKHTLKLSADAASFAPGKYAVGLSMPDEMASLRDIPEYAIRCANMINFENGINDLEINVEL
jgi:hypothetical protein